MKKSIQTGSAAALIFGMGFIGGTARASWRNHKVSTQMYNDLTDAADSSEKAAKASQLSAEKAATTVINATREHLFSEAKLCAIGSEIFGVLMTTASCGKGKLDCENAKSIHHIAEEAQSSCAEVISTYNANPKIFSGNDNAKESADFAEERLPFMDTFEKVYATDVENCKGTKL